MSESGRPVPVSDAQSAPYWAAAARHELVAAHCRVCKMFAIPPDVVCPHCGAVDSPLSFEPLTGRGIVRSWTVVEDAIVPGFADQVPFLLGQFNFFQSFDVCFFRPRGVFEIMQPGTASSP